MNESGLSVNQLAELSGVSSVSIYNYLAGKTFPSPRARDRLSIGLGVRMKKLFPEEVKR